MYQHVWAPILDNIWYVEHLSAMNLSLMHDRSSFSIQLRRRRTIHTRQISLQVATHRYFEKFNAIVAARQPSSNKSGSGNQHGDGVNFIFGVDVGWWGRAWSEARPSQFLSLMSARHKLLHAINRNVGTRTETNSGPLTMVSAAFAVMQSRDIVRKRPKFKGTREENDDA